MLAPKNATILCLFLSLLGCRSGEQPVKPEGLRLMEGYGCMGCHSLDGSKKIGPSLKGLCGREVVVRAAGGKRTITVDRAYLQRSILDPQAEVVDGFEPTMPAHFKAQLGEAKLNTILDYLDSINDDRSKSCSKAASAGAPIPNKR